MVANLPAADTPLPPAVLRLVRGEPAQGEVEPLWLNEIGGLTVRDGQRIIKWNPSGNGLSLDPEIERMRWLAPWHPVPVVLDSGSDESGEWLVTERLPGESAVSERWKRDAATAVRAIAAGLRALHDGVPVEECPWDWSVERRSTGAAHLGPPPPIDRLVVCHGDACAPNTLLDETGEFLATVDLGALGVADRWADLAVASMSLGWNFGEGWDATFYAAYGVERDATRESYYRALWNAEE